MAGGIIVREAHFPGRAPVDAYGNGGFRFADMSHRGSILCLPSGVHGWEPRDPSHLTSEDFHQVMDEAERHPDPAGWCRQGSEDAAAPRYARCSGMRSISVDPMSTGAAVRTYNVLLAEDRAVAAALIAVD